jgi:hypothetical protein
MRTYVALAIGTMALTSAAGAEAQGVALGPDHGYVEGVAQSAFGNVTSQSYGAELGVTIVPGLQVFVEGGQIRNVATPDIGVNAQKIADALTALQSGAVGFSVKEPATFFAAGLRYLIPISSSGQSPIGKVQPYVMGGFGAAKVEHNVSFTIGGTDVTGNLQQYGVVLGTDLAGSVTKPMLSLGGGVTLPVWRQLVLDFQYRYGRIFDDTAIVAQRAGIGLGVGF